LSVVFSSFRARDSVCAEVRPSNSFLSTPEKKRETKKNMFRVLNPNRFGALFA
jgi:hypothetical protein